MLSYILGRDLSTLCRVVLHVSQNNPWNASEVELHLLLCRARARYISLSLKVVVNNEH
jgi:hypothetical protein